MRSFHAAIGAGIDGVVCRERDVPEPGPGQLLVRVRACSLNWREILVVRDAYPLPLADDVVLCCDGAGEVVAAGEGVAASAVGRRVMPSVFPHWLDGPFDFARAGQLGGSLDGLLAEYALVDAASAVTVPDHLTFEQAACLPCAALTAWNALTGGAGLRVGESVLTLGSGAVSLFAVQIARAAGARVVSTTGSPDRAERLGELGADVVIDRRAADWPARVVAATGGGADHTVEVAGTLRESLAATAVGGELALVGAVDSSAAATPIDLAALRSRLAAIRPIAVGSRAQFAALARMIATTKLTPLIDRVFAFEDSVEALRHLERHRPLGKVVIAIPG
jgi:NADPH:quinone reductase-like Zn-dependent oxidoreductase